MSAVDKVFWSAMLFVAGIVVAVHFILDELLVTL